MCIQFSATPHSRGKRSGYYLRGPAGPMGTPGKIAKIEFTRIIFIFADSFNIFILCNKYDNKFQSVEGNYLRKYLTAPISSYPVL